MTATLTPGLALRLADVSLGYDGSPVITGLTLDVRPGEILVVVGSSGCGKSTMLRSLAGLLRARSGRVLAGGAPVTGPSADRALIFQDDALLPWRTTRRNVELPLAIRGVGRAERRERSEHWLEQVGLGGHGGRLPGQLSGGMRQRAQLARALAGEPKAILMDEPFGALDAQSRAAMQQLLITVWRANPATIVFVTHDVEEALFLGDRIVVLGADGVRLDLAVPNPRDLSARGAAEVAAARTETLAALAGRN